MSTATGNECGRQGMAVAGLSFRRQQDLHAHVRAILYGYPLGASVSRQDQNFLHAFFARHERATEKFGCGLASVQVVSDTFGGRRFQITRVDGSTTDISIQPCLRQITPLVRFRATCRRAVVDQIVAFKRSAVGAGQSWADLHVDHVAPLTFERLVDEFIRQENLAVDAVAYVARGDNHEGQSFADTSLERRWQAFHQDRACLRVIGAQENLRLPRRAAQKERIAQGLG